MKNKPNKFRRKLLSEREVCRLVIPMLISCFYNDTRALQDVNIRGSGGRDIRKPLYHFW